MFSWLNKCDRLGTAGGEWGFARYPTCHDLLWVYHIDSESSFTAGSTLALYNFGALKAFDFFSPSPVYLTVSFVPTIVDAPMA